MFFIRYILLVLFFFSTPLLAHQTSNDLSKVSVQLKWRHQFQFAGYYAAIEKGFYQENGLEVELLERKPGPTPIDQLLTENVDFAIAGIGALIYRLNGVPIVALAATFQQSPSILISRYPKLSQLKHTKVMLTRGAMNAEITAMMNKEGLPASSFDLVPSNQSIDGFLAGDFDAYNGYTTNELYFLTKQDMPFSVFNPIDYGINFYSDILLTTEQKIISDTEEVIRFREATMKGWEYAVKYPNEIVDLIIKKYNTQGKKQEQLLFEAKELIKLIHADIVPIGYMSHRRWIDIVTTLQETGDLSKKTVNIEPFLYTSYLSESIFSAIVQYKKQLFLLVCLLFGLVLLLHNMRLKRKIAEKTKLLNQSKLQAEQDARTDILTGLANRRYCMEVLEHDIAIARRNELALSIIYLDIDWFKKINDKYGHGAGDEALIKLAQILKLNIRKSDTAARFGGEEFIVVCLEKDTQSAENLAERIREEVESTIFYYEKINFSFTVSCGVASFQMNNTVNQLLKNADLALYQAKESGRNNVKCFE